MVNEFTNKNITTVLADVVGAVVGHFEMEKLLNQIINITMKTLQAEVCSIFLEDKEKQPGILRCVAGSGFAKKIIGIAYYKIGEGHTGMVAKTGVGYHSKSREEHENRKINRKKVWLGKFDERQWPSGESEFRNGIGLPLRIKDQILGVIKVENKIGSDYFTDEDLIIFTTIANVIALAIENARLLQRTEIQLKAISAKAAHRLNNQAANYDGIDLDLEYELRNPICNKNNLSLIHNRLINTTKNIKNMIGEFRNYGKPLVLEKRVCSINKIIKEEVWYAKPPDKIEIECDLDNNVKDILLDGGRFSESIKELLSNSIKTISEKHSGLGKIRITTRMVESNNVVMTKIEDSGPGFPPNFPIFEPFNSTDPQSTGLGLATVKELIENHGGSIWTSKSNLGGACIEFTIPV